MKNWINITAFNLKNLILILVIVTALTVQVVQAPTFNNALNSMRTDKIKQVEPTSPEVTDLDKIKIDLNTKNNLKPLWILK